MSDDPLRAALDVERLTRILAQYYEADAGQYLYLAHPDDGDYCLASPGEFAQVIAREYAALAASATDEADL